MNTPYPPGAVLNPDVLDDEFIAMAWRPVPGDRDRGGPGDCSPLKAHGDRQFARRSVDDEDELNETFLRFTTRARSASPGD
jgi:hypothetical protein